MAKLQTCQDAFRVGRAERDNHPLRSGLYKLEEARQDIESWRELLSTIAARLRSGGTFGADENLGPCMAQERGIYLKGLPGRLAQLIGYKILPGIAALGGDGIPRVEVERLLHSAQTKAQHLIADCESVRLRLEGGIDHEYREMRQGNGALIGLLGAANELLDTPPVNPRASSCRPQQRV